MLGAEDPAGNTSEETEDSLVASQFISTPVFISTFVFNANARTYSIWNGPLVASQNGVRSGVVCNPQARTPFHMELVCAQGLFEGLSWAEMRKSLLSGIQQPLSAHPFPME